MYIYTYMYTYIREHVYMSHVHMSVLHLIAVAVGDANIKKAVAV